MTIGEFHALAAKNCPLDKIFILDLHGLQEFETTADWMRRNVVIKGVGKAVRQNHFRFFTSIINCLRHTKEKVKGAFAIHGSGKNSYCRGSVGGAGRAQRRSFCR